MEGLLEVMGTRTSESGETSSLSASGEDGTMMAWSAVVGGSGSERVRFTCLCTDSQAGCLILGTTTGKVHVYTRAAAADGARAYKFHRIASFAEGAGVAEEGAPIVEIAYHEGLDACAVACSSGRVHVFHLGLRGPIHPRGRGSKPFRLALDRHAGRRVTQLAWARANGALQLCTGDDAGTVLLTDVVSEASRSAKTHPTLFSSKKLETGIQHMLKRGASAAAAEGSRLKDKSGEKAGPRTEWDFESPVVQISGTSSPEILAVSTKQASFLLHLGRGSSLKIGKKPRNGFYGCCEPVGLPNTDIFNTLRDSRAQKPDGGDREPFLDSIYVAARPGKRLWVAVGDDVKGTMKLSLGASPPMDGDAPTEFRQDALTSVDFSQDNATGANLQLGQIFPLGRGRLLSLSQSMVALVSLEACAVTRAWQVAAQKSSAKDGALLPKVWVPSQARGAAFLLDPRTSRILVCEESLTMPDGERSPGEAVKDASKPKKTTTNGRSPAEKQEVPENGKGERVEVVPSGERSKGEPQNLNKETSAENGAASSPKETNGSRGQGANEEDRDKASSVDLREIESSVIEISALKTRNGSSARSGPQNARKAELMGSKPIVDKRVARRSSRTQAIQPLAHSAQGKHKRNKSGGLSKRNKTKIVEISISKREDQETGEEASSSLGAAGDFFSAASTEQELDLLISNTITMTLEAQKLKSAPQIPPPAADAPTRAAAEEGLGGPDKSEVSGREEAEGKTEEAASVGGVSADVWAFLGENSGTRLDPWGSYLSASSEEVRTALLSWESGLSDPKRASERQRCKNLAAIELAGALKTLDASLAIFPLLQWLRLTKDEAAPDAKASTTPPAEDAILASACQQLELSAILHVDEREPSRPATSASPDRGGANSLGAKGSGIADEVAAVTSAIREHFDSDACEDMVREALLSRPSDSWCAILSESLERIILLELPGLKGERGEGEGPEPNPNFGGSARAEDVEKMVEVVFGMGWNLIGREFAFELMNSLVSALGDHASPSLDRVVRNLCHFLVQMQEREARQDKVAAEILDPIGHRAAAGNSLTLGSALEISLNYDLNSDSFDATDAGLREAEALLRAKMSQEATHWGHWGLRAHIEVTPDHDAIVFPRPGQVYHRHACPEDAPPKAMPKTLLEKR